MTAGRMLLPVWIGALACCSVGSFSAYADPPKYAHRPLTEALENLRAQGLNLIYSSDLVRPDLLVQAEPRSEEPRGILEELLVPFGLATREGPGDTLLVVPATDKPSELGSIAGRILTRGEGRPVSDAAVAIVGTSRKTLSGRDGSFSIPDVPPGAHVLEVSAPGLEARRFGKVQVVAGVATQVSLDLPVVPTLRETVQVDSGPAIPGGDQTEPRTTLKQDSLERRTQLGDDLHRALAGSPGMVTGDKSAALSIRGGEPGESLVILDGLPIEEPLHLRDFLGFSSIIDSRTIARADILGGGFPAQYGDHLSGVLDLYSVEPTREGRTLLSTSLIGSSLLTDGAFGERDGRWLVSARTWYPDAVLDIVDPGGEDISPVYHDVLAKAELPLGGGRILTGNVLAASDSVDFVNDFGDVGVTARNLSDYIWLSLASPWTSRLYSRTLVSRASVGHERSGSLPVGDAGAAQVRDEREFLSYGLAQDWIFQGPWSHSMKWGFSARRVDAEYEYASHAEDIMPLLGGLPATTDRLISLAPVGENYGAYFSDRMSLSPTLVLEAGARWDRQSATGEHQLSPRVNVAFTPGSRTTFRAAWGRFFQSQALYDLQVEDGQTGIYPAQESEHRLVGFDHVIADGLILSASAYSKAITHPRPRYENLFNPIQIFPEVEPDRVLVAPRRATSEGLELSLSSYRGRSVAWSAGYALASARDEIDGAWVPRSWDQRHTFNFTLSYRKGDTWSFDFAGVYHSGWPTTPVEAESVTASDGTTTIQPILGARNSARYPAYHRLDMKAGRHIPVGHGSLTLFLEVTNLYGRDNVCCVEDFQFVPRSDGSVEVKKEEGFWLRQIPVFGLTWEFGR